jgi:hypothetical protein
MWELFLIGVAVLWWVVAFLREPGPGSDLIGVGFAPVVSAGLVVAILRLLVYVGRSGFRFGESWRAVSLLVWRRSTGVAAGRIGVAAPIAVAVAVGVFASAVANAATDGIEDKATVAVGAETSGSAPVGLSVSGLPQDTGLMWAGSATLPTGRIHLVVVDPESYPRSVAWPGGDVKDTEDVLRLVEYTGETLLPVVVSGPGAPAMGSEGTARIQGVTIHYEVVGTVEAIPAMSAVLPTMFTSADSLMDWAFGHPEMSLVDRIITPSGEKPDRGDVLRGLRRRVVSGLEEDRAEGVFRTLGVPEGTIESRQEVLHTPEFVGQRWAFAYMQVLSWIGVALALLVVGFVVVESTRRAVVTRALAERMGLGQRVSGLLIGVEVAILLMVGVGVGVVVGALLLHTTAARFDPLPEIAPALDPSTPWIFVLLVTAAAAVFGLVVWQVADRAARRVDVAEVMRSE